MDEPQHPPDRRLEDKVLRRLIEAVAKNLDRVAFAELFDRLAPRIKSFMLRKGASAELAEDLVQDTMIAVWTKAGLYAPDKGSVAGWVFTIARNLRIDRLRRNQNVNHVAIEDFDCPSDGIGPDEELALQQQREGVMRALESIPEDQKQILILSFIEDVPQSAIAERLNLPLGTVKSRMRLAYGRLRKTLENLK
ncbi:MAG: sigma-70 family RNA polymerase sigma factor [Alphaproteobacteria bacterium]|nr:sigma-70 family RNA polymerase sigma factor [Alphaproteobacteria bacterium]